MSIGKACIISDVQGKSFRVPDVFTFAASCVTSFESSLLLLSPHSFQLHRSWPKTPMPGGLLTTPSALLRPIYQRNPLVAAAWPLPTKQARRRQLDRFIAAGRLRPLGAGGLLTSPSPSPTFARAMWECRLRSASASCDITIRRYTLLQGLSTPLSTLLTRSLVSCCLHHILTQDQAPFEEQLGHMAQD